MDGNEHPSQEGESRVKKKRKLWKWLILVVILLVVVVFFLMSRSGGVAGRYTEVPVRQGTIETYYSFSGNVAVRDSQAIASKVSATVRDIYVVQDQRVAAGAPLMRLSNGDVLKADIAGEITEVHVSEGDAVSVGAALIDIVNFDDLQVLIKVDEFDVVAVSIGKTATVTIDALGLVYEATVEHISKQSQSSVSGMTASSSSGEVNYYEAKLSAPEDERILPGMKVDVRILNERAEDVLLLSMEALQFDAYNKPYVLMAGGERASDVVEVPVEVGIQDGTTVEIMDGVSEGDIVLAPQSNAMFPMMGRT